MSSPSGTNGAAPVGGAAFNSGRLMVIKVGTSTLMKQQKNADGSTSYRMKLASIGRLIEVIIDLREKGHRVVLVSSGAVGAGCIKLQL